MMTDEECVTYAFENENLLRSTYLSDNIYEFIIAWKNEPPTEISECISESLFFNWKTVDLVLENISEDENIYDKPRGWFCDKVKLAWSVMSLAHEKLKTSSPEERIHILPFCSWLGNYQQMEVMLTNYDLLGDNDVIFWVLKFTSHLERSLGDIYAISEECVPFLLKDLLASEFLENTLGTIQVRFLQLLMGCVQGLNLRNVAWHGFFSPGELHMKIIAIFLITTASLGKQIADMDYVKRPLIKATYMEKHSKLLSNFYLLINLDKNSFMKCIQNCKYISVHHWSSWNYAFDLFQSSRYGDSLIFMIPLLENMLRLIFCKANDCPEKNLTAESSAYYIILDDMLAQHISNGRENKLIKVLETELFIMLLDLFVYQEGPRLRDKISHCEVDVNDIPQAVAEYTFGMTSSLIASLLKQNDRNEIIPNELFVELISIPQKYIPLYHPASLLITSMLAVVDKVSYWKSLPVPLELQMEEKNNFMPAIRTHQKHESLNVEGLYHELKMTLETTLPLTLFRSKQELELISIFRKIISNIEIIDDNIVINSQKKYVQWIKREMKSRTRDNYKRMLSCLPLLHYGLALFLFSLLEALKSLYEREIEDFKNLIRTYKRHLQFVENISSMSSLKKNRWIEIKESTINFMNLSKENKKS